MPPTETGRKKILVVEDHDEFRHFLVEQLQKDFCVVEARDGVEGEQVARTELPDLIVSDLMMPRMDGMELCRRLKGDIQTSHIPFILLTARSSDDSRIGGYEAGADSYISKPFNWEMLQVRVRQLIEQKERRQKMFRKSIDVSFEAITTTSIIFRGRPELGRGDEQDPVEPQNAGHCQRHALAVHPFHPVETGSPVVEGHYMQRERNSGPHGIQHHQVFQPAFQGRVRHDTDTVQGKRRKGAK